jgi:hypothetical protein
VAAELDAEQFSWDALGGEHSPSTPINLKRLIDGILERAAGAELDRGFDMEAVVFSQAEGGSSLDSMLGVGQTSREGAVYDNEAQFRFYARWRYLVARAERRIDAGGGWPREIPGWEGQG